jgi:uroporphyrin-III C-methyltransferase
MTVYLVGAGPGDPELITVRGARLLGGAEVVVHDRLAAPLLALARPGAELVNVGKARGSTPVPQEEINAILVEAGRRQGCVVRLKGGDPFVVARGGEEAEALAAAGVSFDVVPGVSSVLGAPAAAGIPITKRGVAQSFTVLTGHEDPALWPDERWDAIAGVSGTILVLMGADHIGEIAQRLVKSGLGAQTPVAAIHAATTSRESISVSSLGEVGDGRYRSPTTFVIGEVVRHRLKA